MTSRKCHTEPAIDTFLFDIGNVLVTFDFSKAVRLIAADSASDAQSITGAFGRLIVPLESGAIDGETFLSGIADAVGFRGGRSALRAAYQDIFEANAAMHRLVDSLAKRYRLILFSNTSALHKDWLFEQFPVFSRFEGGVFSYTSGSMKPDDGMYADAIRTFGVNPRNTVYLDDGPANIATGRRHGFHAIPYDPDRHADTLGSLAALGVGID